MKMKLLLENIIDKQDSSKLSKKNSVSVSNSNTSCNSNSVFK